jgi:hypothetical protein
VIGVRVLFTVNPERTIFLSMVPLAWALRTAGHEVRRNLGVSGQYAAVDEKLTGFENLTMVGELYGMRRREAKARARELLRDFRLAASNPTSATTGLLSTHATIAFIISPTYPAVSR